MKDYAFKAPKGPQATRNKMPVLLAFVIIAASAAAALVGAFA